MKKNILNALLGLAALSSIVFMLYVFLVNVKNISLKAECTHTSANMLVAGVHH